ncbi:pyridoxamine 5'-phosphate oxidase family protein [Caulobacter vibrioides]|uniref:pyridoxamine 5'-phosphate oxidase family protein n=1 Tax=Caulobacter vibrioides TaxID=155892 RepID=UPI000BB46E4D|nr:pyridoxamine 5'-phosphate oxidase family protein [Caulobacter vibrioides]ATC25567.1 pyridoxamine 5'-phosphate oxidase family protein [Caulobacter vibrioides]AZH13656.1 pyridoxamine 5'-phosphate oxidase family protein [Caulobacter vibrioides]PLR14528.1 pyridoxamine 5'-phosphate oxidase family protein [Caulobacter vibrioides]
MHQITTVEALEALYQPAPVPASTVKVSDHITAHYAALIQASPFVALATVGPEGLDCSPRGDLPGFVRIAHPRTLMLPDRRGNNRIDSLRNIVRDPRVALLFLIPGSGTTFRVNGRAVLSADPALLDSFAVDGKPPRTVTVVTVEEAYFQCARAIVRSGLWKLESQVDPQTLPTPGAMLAAVTAGEVGGEAYDREWPGRAAKSLW